jgi:hypothetical protein
MGMPVTQRPEAGAPLEVQEPRERAEPRAGVVVVAVGIPLATVAPGLPGADTVELPEVPVPTVPQRIRVRTVQMGQLRCPAPSTSSPASAARVAGPGLAAVAGEAGDRVRAAAAGALLLWVEMKAAGGETEVRAGSAV